MAEIVWEALKTAALMTAGQLASVLGVFCILGLVLHIMARMTRNTFARAADPRIDLVLTGWLGTPIHEFGHLLFCLIFRHSIIEVRWFNPIAKDGSLGYVKHSYEKRSVYQNIGNLFIGAGPILLGTAILYLLTRLLMPAPSGLLSVSWKASVAFDPLTGWNVAKDLLVTLVRWAHAPTWRFWAFLYGGLCVASHMQLSPDDLKGAFSGFLWLTVLLLLVNLAALPLHLPTTSYAILLQGKLLALTGVFVLAITLSTAFFAVSYGTLTLFSLLRGRGLVNPF